MELKLITVEINEYILKFRSNVSDEYLDKIALIESVHSNTFKESLIKNKNLKNTKCLNLMITSDQRTWGKEGTE
jgi:hypothetical protein